jgi:hypothetical protein
MWSSKEEHKTEVCATLLDKRGAEIRGTKRSGT